MDRRRVLMGAVAGMSARASFPAFAESSGKETHTFASGGVPITVEWFSSGQTRAPAVLLLHGAEGLALASGYRLAAGVLAASGFGVGFVHYLERTGDRRAMFSEIRRRYPIWADTVRDGLNWLVGQPEVAADRIGLVGVSLGAALAFEAAAADERVKAVVNYFGPLLEGFPQRAKRLPPTLILHGARDGVVSVDHALEWEKLLKYLRTPYEIKIYPEEGHGFLGAAQLDSAARVKAFLTRYLAGTNPPG